jgi:hypothetical protein
MMSKVSVSMDEVERNIRSERVAPCLVTNGPGV